jgi:hypothetical protein
MTLESLLQQMAREAKSTEHPSPVPMHKGPAYEGHWYGVGRRAVERLSGASDIATFMEEYSAHISSLTGASLAEARLAANRTVGYCTGYVDDEQANKWFEALPDISHPVMERERPFMEHAERDSMYLVFDTTDPEVIGYLGRRLRETLVNATITYAPTPDGKRGTLQMSPTSGRWGSAGDTFMYLAGLSQGFPDAMEQEIGKTCKIEMRRIVYQVQ